MRLHSVLMVGVLAAAMSLVALPADASPATASPALAATPYAVTRPPAAAQRVAKLATPDVTVMSMNVCGVVCRRGEVKNTAAYAARTARNRAASVVMFQELCYSQFVRIRSLLKKHGYTGRFGTATRAGTCDNHDRRYGTGFGVAVFARGATSGTALKRLPTPKGYEPRVLIGTYAKVGGRRTFVASVHLAPSSRGGLDAQLKSLSAYLNQRAAAPAIVGGDFNAVPTHPGLTKIYSRPAGGTGRYLEMDERRGGKPARAGAPTFDAGNRKIDYIFAAERWFANPRATSYRTTMTDHRVYIGKVRVHRP